MGKSNDGTGTVHENESYVEPLLMKHAALRDPFGNLKSGDKEQKEENKDKFEKDFKEKEPF